MGITTSAKAGTPAAYGAKARFAKGTPLAYPDFTLTYTGSRKVSSPTYPRGFVYHDFTVMHGKLSQTISWSSGTGDIGPTVFRFHGGSFRLEMSRSDKLGRLAENEIVVWRD